MPIMTRVDFRPQDPSFHADPLPIFRQILASGSVRWSCLVTARCVVMALTLVLLATGGALRAQSLSKSAAGGAASLRVASWNLGWHVATAELPNWISTCSGYFRKSRATAIWERAGENDDGAIQGWQVTESRAKLEGVDLAKMPPCAVYQDGRRQGIAVTPQSWAKRLSQIQQILATKVNADVIAFQEVSGVAAVREALGPLADQFNVCSFDGKYKVQRLAFAWKKALGAAAEPCAVVHEMSLPDLPIDDQVRPGLTMALRIDGKLLRLMTVHLKSSCVSALDRGRLDDDDLKSPCTVLQRQVQPFEAAFEKLGAGGAHFILIGDLNRNLWHDANQVAGAAAVRSDGSHDLTAPLDARTKTQNLWLEINDGQPPESRAVLLQLNCAGDVALQKLCEDAHTRVLDRKELRQLAAADALGCRNSVALDQAIVSQTLAASVRRADKLAIGKFGGTMNAKPPKFADPVLAVSDHCPMLIELLLP